VIGPIARSVDDLALALSLIAGDDGHDASVVPMPLGTMASVDLGALRVAHFVAFDGAQPSAEVVAAVGTAVVALQERGARTVAACPPRIEEALAISRAYWARTESASLQQWCPSRSSTFGADDVARSTFEWDRLRRCFLQFMQPFDLIVCPAAADAAPARAQALDTDFIYTLPFSLTGYPCVVVRAGTSAEGLPIGVQIVARPWQDHVALAAARLIEQTLGGWPALR
jgi:amidase